LGGELHFRENLDASILPSKFQIKGSIQDSKCYNQVEVRGKNRKN